MANKKKLKGPIVKVVQIKGSNGSGKTTLVKLLGELSENWSYIETEDGMIIATMFDDIGWVAIGEYKPDAAMGGCDKMPDIESIKQAIISILTLYPDYWIVFEGMMISTIKSTFYEMLMMIHAENPRIEPLFVILQTTPEGCFKRIQGRGTMKPGLNMDNVTHKCDMVIRHAKEYDPDHVRWINIENTSLDGMLGEFLWEVQDNQLMDALYGNDFGGYDEA